MASTAWWICLGVGVENTMPRTRSLVPIGPSPPFSDCAGAPIHHADQTVGGSDVLALSAAPPRGGRRIAARGAARPRRTELPRVSSGIETHASCSTRQRRSGEGARPGPIAPEMSPPSKNIFKVFKVSVALLPPQG